MAALVELCPEADLGYSSFGTANEPSVKAEAVSTKAKGTKPVTTRFDDADDDAPVEAKGKRPATAVVTDDFMDEADAILNS
jgi:hypothetical protein